MTSLFEFAMLFYYQLLLLFRHIVARHSHLSIVIAGEFHFPTSGQTVTLTCRRSTGKDFPVKFYICEIKFPFFRDHSRAISRFCVSVKDTRAAQPFTLELQG